MTEQELLQMRDLAEAGQVQFKERANDRYEIGCEMVAFSNTRGGRIKRKVFDMSRFAPVFRGKGIDELNMKDYSPDQMAGFVVKGTSIEKLLRNLHFIRPDGKLTVAAILLFGKYTQRWMPMMTAKCISFLGNSVGGTQFRDKMHDMEIEGNILHQFHTIMNFFTRNLRKVQVVKEFNSLGELEIPYESLTEYVVNALVHRSLNIKAPIRIFIFDNRVEIHSPGTLPNGLTIEDIKNGTSMPRNSFLFTNAMYLLPYTGAGSGVRRALEYAPEANFANGVADREITHSANEFLITIPRNVYGETEIPHSMVNERGEEKDEVTKKVTKNTTKSNQESNQETPKSNQETEKVTKNTTKSNQETEKATKKVTKKVSKNDTKSNQETPPLTKPKLTKKEEDIRNFCSIPRTAQEIMDRLGVSNQSKNRQKYITSLVDAGVLERTIPENPKDRNQKYRRKK